MTTIFSAWRKADKMQLSKKKTVCIYLIGLFSVTHLQDSQDQKCKVDTCRLPDCRCSHAPSPNNLSLHELPQMVIFTFDDAVTQKDYNFYNTLFAPDRRNPNGCPISMTMFVQHNYTDYDLVNKLYLRGMEAAVHSITHRTPASFWKKPDENSLKMEVLGQRDNLHRYASIPMEKIKGWRSPFLQSSGDLLYEILKRNGFTYDSTLIVGKKSADDNIWPFTMDHGWPLACPIEPCPHNRYAGLWEFPISPMVAYTGKYLYTYPYVDSYRPDNSSHAFKYLMSNFLAHYRGNRVPFLINMHSAWFYNIYVYNFYAMDLFIRQLLTYEDVYVVNMQQALEWMRNPLPLRYANNFQPWNCENPKSRKRSRETPTMYVPTTTAPSTPKMQTTSEVPVNCVQEVNCKRPACRCDRDLTKLTRREIPQIVLFTFDDAVTINNEIFYHRLFKETRINPNGCPISMTLFIQHMYTDYSIVRKFYDRGMEVALHSVTHRTPNRWWIEASRAELLEEVQGMRRKIENRTGIPQHHLVGWRSPFLQATGDILFTLLKDYQFAYDSTLSVNREFLASDQTWPFTLDFGWQRECPVPTCPRKQYKGLWELPVVSLIDPITRLPCSYVDSCRPDDENKSYDYLMTNFMSYYNGTRAPFMLNMHAAWFGYGHNIEAMDRFVKQLLTLDDVYVITIQQALEWLKDPIPLEMVKNFVPWSCKWRPSTDKNSVKFTEKSSRTIITASKAVVTTTKMKSESFVTTNVGTSIGKIKTGGKKENSSSVLDWYVIMLIVLVILALLVIGFLVLMSNSKKRKSASVERLEKLALALNERKVDQTLEKSKEDPYFNLDSLKNTNEPRNNPLESEYYKISDVVTPTAPSIEAIKSQYKMSKANKYRCDSSLLSTSSGAPRAGPTQVKTRCANRTLPHPPLSSHSKNKRRLTKSANRYEGNLEAVKKSVINDLDAFSQGHSNPATTDDYYHSIDDGWRNLNLQSDSHSDHR